jgi:hypothetical protein
VYHKISAAGYQTISRKGCCIDHSVSFESCLPPLPEYKYPTHKPAAHIILATASLHRHNNLSFIQIPTYPKADDVQGKHVWKSCHPSNLEFVGSESKYFCPRRQGCYGPEDVAIITPYTGQLMRLRRILEKHTVVQLEDADAKLVQDMEQRAAEKSEAEKEPHMLKVVQSSLKAKLRLATVDNFQGNHPFLLSVPD